MEYAQRPEFSRKFTDGKLPGNVPPNIRPSHRKTLVLCFDGTGNKFHGDSSDSNILKIFRMLDRSSGLGFHYYQPGIGTYVTTGSLSTKGNFERLKDWYRKTKDTAVGTSFDHHVVGGYKFLMQYYTPGDDIFMFGFSRGAYTARFLAEMLDWIGLVTFGNEEMIQFAWRTFSEWKMEDGSAHPEAMKRRKKAYEFMVSFRETFSRPVKRIRFLGLFDTVNSVPRFENAMMRTRRQHMPYSAISSAKVIRHAVSIDERRAKFRSDLISPDGRHKKQTDAAIAKHMKEKAEHRHLHEDSPKDWLHEPNRFRRPSLAQKTAPIHPREEEITNSKESNPTTEHSRFRRASMAQKGSADGPIEANHRFSMAPRVSTATEAKLFKVSSQRHDSLAPEAEPRFSRVDMTSASRYRTHSRSRSRSPGARSVSPSFDIPSDDESDGDEDEQDIDELWFPGGHADIGGGWRLKEGEIPLAHLPLVWIVLEAQKCGLQFDEEKMRAMGCLDETEENIETADWAVPKIEVEGDSGGEIYLKDATTKGICKMSFREQILHCAKKSAVHDCLAVGQGLPFLGVLSWQIMEWIPFMRMDLRDDGSWKPIRWPLPRGEVRDMPDEAKVHHSAIRRMEADPNYRPGNLILGGGGRGVKKAPVHAGIGEWELAAKAGDLLGECFVRRRKTTTNTVVSAKNPNGLKTVEE